MGILRVESFDHWATADGPKKDWLFIYNATVSPGNGRNGTASLRSVMSGTTLGQGILGVKNLTSRYGVIGFAMRPVTLPGGIATFFGVVESASGTNHLQLRLHSTGALSVTQNSTPVVPATAGGVITGATWQYVEFAWYIHQTLGSLEVRVNGATVLSATNVDTFWGGSGVWTGVEFGGGSTNVTIDFDDVYVADDNIFRGDHRIIAMVASPGNGTHTQWLPSAGTNHGEMVDDPTPNTSDYNSAGVPGLRDTYNFAALGVTGTVTGVQPCAYMKADVGGVRRIAPCTRPIGGPDYDDDAGMFVLGPDWRYYTVFQPTNPSTVAPWTVAVIDASEFGVKVDA